MKCTRCSVIVRPEMVDHCWDPECPTTSEEEKASRAIKLGLLADRLDDTHNIAAQADRMAASEDA